MAERSLFVLGVGLSDASHDAHYSQLYDSCCLQVSSTSDYSSAVETERRYFMSRLNDVIMRLLFYQVPLQFCCFGSSAIPCKISHVFRRQGEIWGLEPTVCSDTAYRQITYRQIILGLVKLLQMFQDSNKGQSNLAIDGQISSRGGTGPLSKKQCYLEVGTVRVPCQMASHCVQWL